MTTPETGNLYANVQNNNNIVWKNITIVDEEPGAGRFVSVLVANFTRKPQRATLVFATPRREKDSIFDWGRVFVELPPELLRLRDPGNDDNHGIRPLDETTFQVLKPGANLGTFKLDPGVFHAVSLRFLPAQNRPLGARVFTLDLVQEVDGRVIGGQRFVVKTQPDLRNFPNDGAAVFDGVEWIGGTHGRSCCCGTK